MHFKNQNLLVMVHLPIYIIIVSQLGGCMNKKVIKIVFLNKEAWWTSRLMALLFMMVMDSFNAEKPYLGICICKATVWCGSYIDI